VVVGSKMVLCKPSDFVFVLCAGGLIFQLAGEGCRICIERTRKGGAGVAMHLTIMG